MNRRQFLATSPAFLAALAVSAKAVGALPVGFPRQFRLYTWWDKAGMHYAWARSVEETRLLPSVIVYDTRKEAIARKPLNMLG